MEQGWIKLHRKILENPIMGRSNYLALWIILLLKTNHKEKKMIWNNSFIVIKEGQFITGRNELASQSGIPPTTVERILKYLESGHQIEQQKNNKYRLITIVNWKEHQSLDIKTDNKRTSSGHQTDTNKNDKNEKNEKKDTTETSSEDIPLLIKSFESLNPASKKFYGNKTQRSACRFLIDTYGLERVQTVIEKTLPKTNGLQYFPTIATPLQLQDKWTLLESAIRKYQADKLLTKEKYKII